MIIPATFAREGTIGYRRDLRQNIRRILGTSSSDAPNIMAALSAAMQLDLLMRAASDGRFGLNVIDVEDGENLPPRKRVLALRDELSISLGT